MSALYRTALPHRCRRCREPIEVGSVVIDRFRSLEEASSSIYHPACLIDVDPNAAHAALVPNAVFVAWIPNGSDASGTPLWTTRKWTGSDVPLADREALVALCAQRTDRIAALYDEASSKRRRKVAEATTKTARDEISRDPKGRPRVSLHFAFIGRDHLNNPFDSERLADQTLRSPLREYVLVETAKKPPIELPWQPFVGALCFVSSYAKLTKHALDRFLQWKALDAPTPALFIIGPAGAARDERERDVRVLLDQAGFFADEAAVLCAETIDDESIASLGALLDESVTIEGATEEAVADLRERAVSVLESTVRERRAEAYVGALSFVRRNARGMTPAMKATAAECAMAALSHEPARRAAIALIQALPPAEDVAPLRELWLQSLRASKRLPTGAEELFKELVRAKDKRCFHELAALLAAEKKPSARSEAWLTLFESCTDRAVAEPLKTWADSIDAKDPRKPKALAVAERLSSLAAPRAKTRG